MLIVICYIKCFLILNATTKFVEYFKYCTEFKVSIAWVQSRPWCECSLNRKLIWTQPKKHLKNQYC